MYAVHLSLDEYGKAADLVRASKTAYYNALRCLEMGAVPEWAREEMAFAAACSLDAITVLSGRARKARVFPQMSSRATAVLGALSGLKAAPRGGTDEERRRRAAFSCLGEIADLISLLEDELARKAAGL
ncbi:MAG: hypothetical protein Kow0025_00060 [Thermodesulfovibrionales bacterium]